MPCTTIKKTIKKSPVQYYHRTGIIKTISREFQRAQPSDCNRIAWLCQAGGAVCEANLSAHFHRPGVKRPGENARSPPPLK